MNMSTNISDLPGPKEEYQEDHNTEEYQHPEYQRPDHTSVPIEPKNDINSSSSIKILEEKLTNENNIDFDIFSELMNRENWVVFILLFISTNKLSSEYTQKITSLLPFHIGYNMISLIKCIILVFIFILYKHFLN